MTSSIYPLPPERQRPEKRHDLPVEEICQRYQQGESAYAIAKSLGISPLTVTRRLVESGIVLRTRSEAHQLVMDALTPEQRKAWGEPSRIARIGTSIPFDVLCQRALTSQERQTYAHPYERLLGEWLIARGIETIPQKAVGPYNTDLAFNRIAIEINGGWHADRKQLPYAAKRCEYFLKEGWSIIFIWVCPKNKGLRGHPLSVEAADYVAAFIQERHDTPVTRVINGRGEEFPKDHPHYRYAHGMR